MKHSTTKATKADVERFTQLRAAGCICCRLSGVLGQWLDDLEIHHLLSGNRRRGHRFTILLCRWHHRGICEGGREWATKYLGPSLAYGSKPFRAVYGSDDGLLDKSDGLIGVEAVAA